MGASFECCRVIDASECFAVREDAAIDPAGKGKLFVRDGHRVSGAVSGATLARECTRRQCPARFDQKGRLLFEQAALGVRLRSRVRG